MHFTVGNLQLAFGDKGIRNTHFTLGNWELAFGEENRLVSSITNDIGSDAEQADLRKADNVTVG
jgi:hypothetical protein